MGNILHDDYIEEERPSILEKIPFIHDSISYVGECTILFIKSMKCLRREPFEWQEMLKQMSRVGINTIPIILLSCFFSGAVLALYSALFLIKYGVTFLAGGTVGLASAREMSAVMAGIIVTARCGSAITAELGTMVVTEQVDALKSLGVSPYRFLVLPRLIACTLMLPVLSLIGFYSAILGGMLISVSFGIPLLVFTDSIQRFVNPHDIHTGLFKAVVFGILIGLVSCNQGLKTENGAQGVGTSTTRSVVLCIILIYVFNFLISRILV